MKSMTPAVGVTAARMREHVKAIPRRLPMIEAEEPEILTDHGRFVTALVGPA